MSKEDAKVFLNELGKNKSMQNALMEELALFAKKQKYTFNAGELKEVLAESGNILLSDETLEKVAGGAFPTAVNDQITDAVT